MEDWVAYKCSGITHRMMIIESMDRDTKIRRLSPIAMLADPGTNGYIDLVNGPQDFSCCSGYTCAERLSTFFTMVATGLEYEVMMTSIPPQNFKFHILHNGNAENPGDPVRVKMWFPKQQRLDVYTDSRYIPPMNKDFSVTDGHKLFPSDAKWIPKLDENSNCDNYFDPITGHLYLIVKGPSTCDIKTQPVVILKLGITVPEAEFFDADSIVGNIAGLLGIDPANIRITNIVREGSVRKRRAAETLDLQFEIAPAPAAGLNEQDFVPEEVTYTTPADPNAVTETSVYTTPSVITQRPVPVVDPLAMDFADLSRIQSTIATTFQKGDLSAALNVTVAGMAMEDPIPPPKEPPAYTSPEERAVVLETTFAEAAANEDAALLEGLTATVNYEIPTFLDIGRQPYEAAEMAPLAFYPVVYVSNADHVQIMEVGNAADPWKVKAAMTAGPVGATILGDLEIPIIGGFANFTTLHLSQMGEGYQLEFSIVFPNDLTIAPVSSILFNVGPRPLGAKFGVLDSLIPNSDLLNVTFSIWDLGQDIAASPEVLGTQTWECSLAFSINVPVAIVGATSATISDGTQTKRPFLSDTLISAGANTGVFEVKFEGSGLNLQFVISCESPETGR